MRQMTVTDVIAVLDVGKTNKKIFLFDKSYNIIYERSVTLCETVDEDGDSCENLQDLTFVIRDFLKEVLQKKEFLIRAINFSSYGASFVYIDMEGNPVAPLYNYLKPFPESLKNQFYGQYGGDKKISGETASPVLGSLNSGLQLYGIKYKKPELYKKIKWALHLPQYLSFLVSGKVCSDITSLGCHTQLWDFNKENYHDWVFREGVYKKLAPLIPTDSVWKARSFGKDFLAGIGLHDSSAALIPYLVSFQEPFVLLSTGTWCISMNPFNVFPLTLAELEQDCLCYMQFNGKPIKASRLFAGLEHEEQVRRIAAFFNQSPIRYQNMNYVEHIDKRLRKKRMECKYEPGSSLLKTTVFAQRDLASFQNDEEAYHQLILDIIEKQYISTSLVIKGTDVSKIFVDGGFSNNAVFMNMLARAFPKMKVFAASMAQATAIGTALAIQSSWNSRLLPKNLIELQYYSSSQNSVL